MANLGLILEGGGMRGIFSAGVLDFFLDKGLAFDCCYGVSAGACHACNYLSGQRGRGIAVNTDYINNWRYCSWRSFFLTGNMFGAKFLFDEIPHRLNLYDYQAFAHNPCKLYAVLTDCVTGRAVYQPVTDMERDIWAIRASSSLPLVSQMVERQGRKYLDGGIADSIPLAQAIADGCDYNVVILTQHRGYHKAPNPMMPLLELRYHKYPHLVAQMERRHLHYNRTLRLVERERVAGRAFVLRPSGPVNINRLERDTQKLEALYRNGYRTAREQWDSLCRFLTRAK